MPPEITSKLLPIILIFMMLAAGCDAAGEKIPTPVITGEPSGDPGTLIWKHRMGDWVSSSPTVYQVTVYAGSWDNYLYAIDVESGALRWKYPTGGKVDSSPTVSDGVVYVLAQTMVISMLSILPGAS